MELLTNEEIDRLVCDPVSHQLMWRFAEQAKHTNAYAAAHAHALAEAKRRCPNYPWTLNTMSEAVWALGESLLGAQAACDDLRAKVVEQEQQLAGERAHHKIVARWMAAIDKIDSLLGLQTQSQPETWAEIVEQKIAAARETNRRWEGLNGGRVEFKVGEFVIRQNCFSHKWVVMFWSDNGFATQEEFVSVMDAMGFVERYEAEHKKGAGAWPR